MMQLYEPTTTDFTLNGHVLTDVYNDTVNWEMNKVFELTFDYPLFSPHGSQLTKEMIVTVPVPSTHNHDQGFRINSVTKSMGIVTVHAYHLFWDLNQNFIEDINNVNSTGAEAAQHIIDNTQYPNNFKVSSDLANTANARMVRMSAISALIGDDDNSFITRWGGEFEWDNFTINIASTIGENRGVEFRNGKNLTGYTAEENMDSVVTRIMPIGYDGLLLPEKYIDSSLIDNYTEPRIALIEYSDIKAIDPDSTSTDEDAVPLDEAYVKLRAAAKDEFDTNHLDKPTTTIKLNVVLLENTEEYKGLEQFNKVYPGDTARFVHTDDDVDTTAELTGYTWSPTQQSYLTVTFESATKSTPTFSQTISRVTNSVQSIGKDIKSVSANGQNANTYSQHEPTDSDPGVGGDVWYENDGSSVNMWIFTNGHWQEEIHDATGEEIKQSVDAQFQGVATWRASIDSGLAIVKAKNEQFDASVQSLSADIVTLKADVTKSMAEASSAFAKADSAVANALSAQSNASSAVTQASSAAADSKDAQQIAGAVSQSYKTLTDGSTMTIAELESGLAVKLTKNDLDGYSTQSWTQNQIKMTADSINGTMSSIKSTVDGQTTSINDLKADSSSFKSQFTTVNDTLGKHTTDIGSLQVSSKELTTGFNMLTTDNGTNKNDISQLKQTATEVSSTLETVQTQVQNSAVGTNLLTGTSSGLKTKQLTNAWNAGPQATNGDFKIKVVKGQTYTYRAWLDNTADPNDAYVNIRFSTAIGGAGGGSNLGNGTYIEKGETGYSTLQITPTEDGYIKLVPFAYGMPGTVLAGWKEEKLEKGSVATDWCPNLADNATATAVSKLSQTVDGMKVDISNKIEQKDLNGYATQSWSQGQLSIAKNEITASVQNITSDMATQTWTQGKLDLTADGLTSQISSVQNGLDTKYTSLEQTLKGVQITANDAVTQSQYTQLAGQITSTISAVQGGGINLLTGTGSHTVTGTGSYTDGYLSNETTDDLLHLLQGLEGQTVTVSVDYKYSGFVAGSGQNRMFWEMTILVNGTTRYFGPSYNTGSSTNSSGSGRLSATFVVPKNITSIGEGMGYIQFSGSGTGTLSHLKLEKGSLATPWSAAPEDIQSQITQTQSMIDLRVEKSGLLSEINMQAGATIVKSNKLYLDASSVIMGGTAFINAANIKTVSASSITAGTLNASLVNVVNLNASSIVAGVLSGAGIVMNLNTGEVEFQKGRIHSSDNQLYIDMDSKVISTSSADASAVLKNGELQLTEPNFFDLSDDPYFRLYHGSVGPSIGAVIEGRGGVAIAESGSNLGIINNSGWGKSEFAGIAIRDGETFVGSNAKRLFLRGGNYASIEIGDVFSNTIDRVTLNGKDIYLHSTENWPTTSNSSNMYRAVDGRLLDVTSASKYKIDIKRTHSTGMAEKLIQLPVATWIDKAEQADFENGNTATKPTRNFGMIAEDLDEVGLEELVVKHDGEVEGLQYDRIALTLIPLIKDMKEQIDLLKLKVEELTNAS